VISDVKRTEKAPVIILTAAFLLSRLIFYQTGITFYGSFIHRMWQAIDPELLKQNLFTSILYSHGQPPLFNLLNGVLIKTFGDHFTRVFQLLNITFSFASGVFLYLTLRQLHFNRWLALSATLYFLLMPAIVLYENLYSYTTLTIFVITSGIYFTCRFIISRNRVDWKMLVCCWTILTLTRSSFHLLWLIATVGLLVWTVPTDLRKKRLILYAIVPVFIVFAWYLKNWIIFDSFSSSSWLGMNIARIMPPDSDLGHIKPFEELASYRGHYTPEAPSPHAILNQKKKTKGYINFHHLDYVRISRAYFHESMKAINTSPEKYFGRVADAQMIFFSPATRGPFIEKNLFRMEAYAKWLTLDFQEYTSFRKHTFRWSGSWPPLLILLATLAILAAVWKLHGLSRSDKTIIIFLTGLFTYGMLVGTMLEFGENNRFRFELIPVTTILPLLAGHRLYYIFNRSKNDLKV
jgi:hypothetical protein